MADVKESLLKEMKELDRDKKMELVAASQMKQGMRLNKLKKHKIKMLRMALGDSVIAECPHCDFTQRMGERMSVKCGGCSRTYTVAPREGRYRVRFMPQNLIPIFQEWVRLQQGGRRECIL